ncbi:MAG: thioredoxin TrxC [Gammaproteobacteria bacterium]|nr:thioredoxin TrxC [Gammaproteobacteria bacterium]
MPDQFHIVCPHCQGINRIPAARLSDNPKCGKCKQPLFQGKPLEVDEAAFQRQISRSDVPLLVDFWAEWCGPCKMMAPMFAQAAIELEPRVRLLKVDTEKNQNLAAQFDIRSIPTIAIFKGGKEVARQAGAMQAPQLIQWVRSIL